MIRKRKKREVRREEKDDPTPETLAKLRPDPLFEIIQEGLLDTAGERAAEEIRQIYLHLTVGLGIKNRLLGQVTGARSEMPDHLASAHKERYVPWTREEKPDTIDRALRLVVEHELDGEKSVICQAITNYARKM